jgi:opacity protein-like surface antigen
MIKHVVSSIVIASALAVAAQAGTSDKTISQPATSLDYGTGAYVAVQGGFNAAQDTFSQGNESTKSQVGGFGGLKAGYVFNTGLVRPAVEFDGFYNGFAQDLNVQSYGKVGRYDANSGAYLVNALAKLNLGAFQPYAGAGIGGYTAEGKVSLIDGTQASSGDKTSWAWQIVAGADYYFTPTMSVFAEYKFLNYMNSSSWSPSNDDRFGQQLAGAGVRFHF